MKTIRTLAGGLIVDAAVSQLGAGRVTEARETVAVRHARSVHSARVVLALTADTSCPTPGLLGRPPRVLDVTGR